MTRPSCFARPPRCLHDRRFCCNFSKYWKLLALLDAQFLSSRKRKKIIKVYTSALAVYTHQKLIFNLQLVAPLEQPITSRQCANFVCVNIRFTSSPNFEAGGFQEISAQVVSHVRTGKGKEIRLAGFQSCTFRFRSRTERKFYLMKGYASHRYHGLQLASW